MGLNENMGGYISAQYVSKNDVSIFLPNRGSVIIKLKPNCVWNEIPIAYMGAEIDNDVESTDNGYKMSNNITLRVPYHRSYADSMDYMSKIFPILGIIVRLQLPNGYWIVYGSTDYPLFGSVAISPSNTSTELRSYTINLTVIYTTMPYNLVNI